MNPKPSTAPILSAKCRQFLLARSQVLRLAIMAQSTELANLAHPMPQARAEMLNLTQLAAQAQAQCNAVEQNLMEGERAALFAYLNPSMEEAAATSGQLLVPTGVREPAAA